MGIIGLILIQSSALFQIYKFQKKKRVEGVSITYWWVMFVGIICYLMYSIPIKDALFITSNSIGIILIGLDRNDCDNHIKPNTDIS